MELSTIMFAVANCLAFYIWQYFRDTQNLGVAKYWQEEMIQLAVFGPDRKGQLQEGEALEYDVFVEDYSSKSDYFSTHKAIPQNDLYVRVMIYNLIFELCKNKEVKYFTQETLIKFLDEDINYTLSVKRYRAWSFQHQRVIRIWQCICAFIPLLPHLENKFFFKKKKKKKKK